MNSAEKKRLIAVANRLTLNKESIARFDRQRCCFCNQPILAGARYKKFGKHAAHSVCISAIQSEIRI